jgi:hypothetical protein
VNLAVKRPPKNDANPADCSLTQKAQGRDISEMFFPRLITFENVGASKSFGRVSSTPPRVDSHMSSPFLVRSFWTAGFTALPETVRGECLFKHMLGVDV